MTFARLGMNSAQPCFWSWPSEPPYIGDVFKASDIAEPVDGRKHHKDWFQTLAHPNAALIAAAPDLHRELAAALAREAALRMAIIPLLRFANTPSNDRRQQDRLKRVYELLEVKP